MNLKKPSFSLITAKLNTNLVIASWLGHQRLRHHGDAMDSWWGFIRWHIFVILFYSCLTIHYEYISIKNIRRKGLILNLTRLVNDKLTHVV